MYESMRKHPVNSFTHPIFYRAFHSGSGFQTPEGDLRARIYPSPRQPSSAMLGEHVENHGWKDRKVKTPFISITPDALRAFNVAACYADKGEVDVTVVVIDGWKLRDGTFEPCNELRLRLGLGENNLFGTETLVWGEIPHRAILFRWRWCDLEGSRLFDLFPLTRWNLPLGDLRRYLREGIQPRWFIQLVTVLVTGLRLSPSSLVTKQISVVMATWREGRAEVKFHNEMENEFSSVIDAELHKKAIVKEKEHEFKDWWMGRERSNIRNFQQERPEPRLSFS
jgi:hypothetical protein